MASNSKKLFLLDTPAFISLESIGLMEKVILYFKVITTNSVVNELEGFSKHSDELGNIARRVLKFKGIYLIEDRKIKEQIMYIEQTDNELFNLAKEKRIPLVSDDHKIIHHTKDKIEVYFSTFFLMAFATAGIIVREDAIKMLEKLRDIRNWRNNIIYLTTKEGLENL
tara:strand:+ start:294 stop:797 length:504 start_codon:yes stop_codon:yes gene_type:complete